jgi:hypothetical protein
VRPDDRALQPGEVALPHRRIGQRAESRVHAVDRRAAPDRRGDDAAAGLHPFRDAGPELGAGLPARDIHHILDGQGVAGDDHCSHG